MTKTQIDRLTYIINAAAIEVHKALGPGLLESVYHKCLKHELTLKKINFESELIVSIHYKGIEVATQLRCDLFIEKCIVVELKSCEKIIPIHEAQTLTYMQLLNAPKGIIYNFNVTNLFHHGQKTLVNEYYRNLPS